MLHTTTIAPKALFTRMWMALTLSVSRVQILAHASLLAGSGGAMRSRSRRIKSNPAIEKKSSFPYFIACITTAKLGVFLVDRHKIHRYHTISVTLSLLERRVFQVEECEGQLAQTNFKVHHLGGEWIGWRTVGSHNTIIMGMMMFAYVLTLLLIQTSRTVPLLHHIVVNLGRLHAQGAYFP